VSGPGGDAPSGPTDKAHVENPQEKKKAQERERLARALRDNLRRRKEQARRRKDTGEAQ
jgi:hypothetical protein